MTLTMEQQLAVANALVAELEHRVVILEKRITHADIETAQARVSRDSYKDKLDRLTQDLFIRALEQS